MQRQAFFDSQRDDAVRTAHPNRSGSAGFAAHRKWHGTKCDLPGRGRDGRQRTKLDSPGLGACGCLHGLYAAGHAVGPSSNRRVLVIYPKKKENLTEADLANGETCQKASEDQGDRWTFVAVLPDTSFVHTLHHGERTLEEATAFVGKIKAKSDGLAPLFSSDDWFYEKALTANYGLDFQPPYKGRGRRPHPKRLPDPALKYVQVQKERDKKGRLLHIEYAIIYGDHSEIEEVFERAVRCKTINTVYVESRNGKFRKDDARLIRKTLCHSKKSVYHDAQANFTAQVMNYTRTNDALKVIFNPKATRFEQKYRHRTPAMAQGLIDLPLTIKELLMRRPHFLP